MKLISYLINNELFEYPKHYFEHKITLLVYYSEHKITMTDRTCERCNKVFDLPCRLKIHQKRKVPCDLIILEKTTEIKKDFKCKHCLRTFTTETSMYRHIRKTCKMVNMDSQHKDILIIKVVEKLNNTVNELLKSSANALKKENIFKII